MPTDDPTSTQLDDQRRAARHAVEAPVVLHLETENLTGVSDNISSAGLMFFSDEPLRVSIEVTGEGGSRKYHGRLVRVQRMSETNTGLAVEFDED